MKNEPDIWIEKFPEPTLSDHKYSRGQVAVMGGEQMTGAACLSADSAIRIGAGLVTIISPNIEQGGFDPLMVYKCFKPYLIARNDMNLHTYVMGAKVKGQVCSVIGPGLGNQDYASIRTMTLSVLAEGCPIILDADGLNAFEGAQDSLWAGINGSAALTPHDGEFKRLFPDFAELLIDDRVKAASAAANLSNAVIVLKGTETIIATPDGQSIINDNAPPYLATAGSGDVLSGMIAGLIAQGMDCFEASCAAVWLHGAAAQNIGLGLVASDIIEKIPELLKETLGIHKKVG